MKYNSLRDHGLVVWARMKKTDKSWAAMIISTKKLDLVFEESENAIWVWWIYDNRFSKLNDDCIDNFCENFESYAKNLVGDQKKGVIQALEIISTQYGIDIPSGTNSIEWAIKNLKKETKDKIGKFRRDESYHIPTFVLEKIRTINNNNIQAIVNQNIKDNLKELKKNKNDNNNTLMVNKSIMDKHCISCRNPLGPQSNNHPLFNGFVCNDCMCKAKSFLMPIIESNTNNGGCCICFTIGKTLIFCDSCIRTFCKNCIDIYCNEKWIAKILAQKIWTCFLCEESSSVNPSVGLQRRKIEDQLINIYDLYQTLPCTENIIHASKIFVLPVNDEEPIVTKMLTTMQFPFELVNYNNDFSITNFDRFDDNLILIVHFCKKNSDKFVYEEFMNFIYLKNMLKDVRNANPKYIFWAFETKASITKEEQNMISMYCDTEPILIGTNCKDVCHRSRFIWSNITIFPDDIARFQKSNIFLQNIVQHYNEDIMDMVPDPDLSPLWCYDSIYVTLINLLKNNLVQI